MIDESTWYYADWWDYPQEIITPENTKGLGLIVIIDPTESATVQMRGPNGKLIDAVGVYDAPNRNPNYAPETDSSGVFIDSE